MADSTKTLTSSSYDGRRNRVVFEQTKDVANNRSKIHWTLYVEGGNDNYYTTGPITIKVNGEQVYYCAQKGWSSYEFPAAKGQKSGDIYVNHSGDGTKTIEVLLSTAIYVDQVSTYKESWTLASIPRYPTANHSLNSKTLTSIKMNWSSDSTIDYLWYSKDDGSSWTGVDVTDGTSGTYTISGLSVNTTYKIKTRLRRKDSQLTKDTSALSVATYDIGKISEAPNINHGDGLTVKYTNPSGSALQIGVFKTDGNTALAGYRACSGTQYSFSFTDAELDAFYKQYGTSSSFKVRVYLKTANAYYNSKEITITLKGNQKTGRVNVNGSWKRSKKWVNVNGSWKRCVRWVNVNGTWRRCI